MDVWAAQYPGRDPASPRPPEIAIRSLAADIAASIASRPPGEFAVFGHSLGALVGFEVCRVLRDGGSHLPRRLVVASHPAPQLPARQEAIHGLPDPEFKEELERLGGTPAEVLREPELMSAFLPVLRAEFRAAETYDYRAEDPLECPLTAFAGLQDPAVSREELDAWSQQTTGPFSSRLLPGGHFFIHSAAPVFLTLLARELA